MQHRLHQKQKKKINNGKNNGCFMREYRTQTH